jgi:hypothetical protein
MSPPAQGPAFFDDGAVLSNNTPKNSKDMERAQAAFHKKEQQLRDGAKAMAEYRAAGDAVLAKTEKLRAMRLAKEEQERAEADAAPPKPAPKPAAKASKAKKKL